MLVGRTARMAWWLSRVAPGLYASLMARRMRDELESDDGTADAGPDRERK